MTPLSPATTRGGHLALCQESVREEDVLENVAEREAAVAWPDLALSCPTGSPAVAHEEDSTPGELVAELIAHDSHLVVPDHLLSRKRNRYSPV